MPITLCGKVMTSNKTAISNIWIALKHPDETLSFIQSDSKGNYCFADLNQIGLYTIYELNDMLVPPLELLPQSLELPLGFNTNLGTRQFIQSITSQALDDALTYENFNFIHTYDEPFLTSSDAYLVHTKENILYTLNLITGKTNPLITLKGDTFYTALSYHPLEDFLFGYNKYTHTLDKIGPSGVLYQYTIDGLPHKNFTAAAFDPEGNLFLYESLNTVLYKICLNSLSFSFLSYTTYSITPLNIISWCFHPISNKLYSLNVQGQVIEIDFLAHLTSTLSTLGTPPLDQYQLISDYEGSLYILSANSEIIYRITLSSTLESASCESYSSTSATNLLENPITRCLLAPLYSLKGSAPSPYRTSLADNGPRHHKNNLLSFEMTPPSALNLTDDYYTLDLIVTNQTNKIAFLYGWIDYNQDGIFATSDALDPIQIPISSKKQAITVTFSFPKKQLIKLGDTYMRLRLTTDNLELDPLSLPHDSRALGACSDGTVLDYPIHVTSFPPYVTGSKYHKVLTNTSLLGETSSIDPSKGSIIYTLKKAPDYGTVLLHTDSNQWEYTPYEDFVGEDHFILSCTSDFSLLSCDAPITLSIESGNVQVTLSASVDESLHETPLVYTATIENIGTLPIEQLRFTTPLPLGFKFISGTTIINHISDLNALLEDGIILSTLHPKEIYTITFQVACTDNSLTSFAPSCTVQGFYQLTPTHSPTKIMAESTSPTLIFKKPSLDISLVTNTDTIFVGDTIQFTAKLLNSCALPLSNISLNLALPMQLSYLGSLSADYIALSDDLLSGYILKELLPNQHVTLQFKCNVTEQPDTPYLACLLFAHYDYVLNHQVLQSKEQATEAKVIVSQPLLDLKKFPDKTSVAVGETFTYTCSCCNKGDLCIDELILTENIPPQLQVVEVAINNRLTSTALSTGISIQSLQPHTTTLVKITYKVLDIPYTNPLITIPTTALCKIYRNDLITQKSFTESILDPSGVLITDASLSLFTTVVPVESAYNEIVTYHVSICNTGTISLTEAKIEDLLSPHLKFIEHSVTINNHPTQDSIISGITLKNLEMGEKVHLSFKAQIISKEAADISTKTSVHYTYTPYQSDCIKFGYTSSPPCTVHLHHPNLNILLSSDKEIAFLGDLLTFKTTIHNTGDVDAFNITLHPILTACELVDGSFMINHTRVNGITLNSPITVGNLKAGASTTIHFKTLVIGESYSTYSVDYSAWANFIYPTSNQCMQPYKSSTCQLQLPFALSTFKQLTLENVLELSHEKPDIESINSAGGQINLLSHYVIETPKGVSEDGQILSGYKAIIHAMLDLTIEYVSSTSTQSIHIAHYSIPFSTFIVLPPTCSNVSQVFPEASIELISPKLINNRCFFIYSTLLVIARLK